MRRPAGNRPGADRPDAGGGPRALAVRGQEPGAGSDRRGPPRRRAWSAAGGGRGPGGSGNPATALSGPENGPEGPNRPVPGVGTGRKPPIPASGAPHRAARAFPGVFPPGEPPAEASGDLGAFAAVRERPGAGAGGVPPVACRRDPVQPSPRRGTRRQSCRDARAGPRRFPIPATPSSSPRPGLPRLAAPLRRA